MDRIWAAWAVLTVFSAFPLAGVEHTSRFVWTNQDQWYSLYRVEDEDVRSEILLSARNSFDSAEPTRFILDSPYCTIGNIRPEGLFRFFEMESMLSRDALKKRAGYSPDSSAGNLNSLGGAFFLPDSGGIFFESLRSEFLNGGGWYNCSPIPYMSLDLAVDSCRPGEMKLDETGWFREDELQPQDTLYHGGGEVRYDSAFWTVGLKSALSLGMQHLPGSSFLPEAILYAGNFSVSLRYWRNSEYYRNRFLEFPDWNWQFQGDLLYHSASVIWTGSLEFGRPRPSQKADPEIVREFELGWQREIAFFNVDLDGAYSYDAARDNSHEIRPKGKISAGFSTWSAGCQTEFVLEGRPYRVAARTFSAKAKYFPFSSFWCGGEAEYSDNLEESVLTPRLEGGIRWKNWKIKGAYSYPFCFYGQSGSLPFTLRFSAEWSA